MPAEREAIEAAVPQHAARDRQLQAPARRNRSATSPSSAAL